MDKYIEKLENLPFDLLHIAQSYATDNHSPHIEPAHLLRALLHKSAGLVSFIEDTLDEDYYYLVDWADMRMHQCGKSPYAMRGTELSHESQLVVREALELSLQCGQENITAATLLASLLTPGIGFSYEQLKTMPLQAEKILNAIRSLLPVKQQTASSVASRPSAQDAVTAACCIPMLSDMSGQSVVGFDKEICSMVEVLARKDRANVLIIGETGVGKTSLVKGIVERLHERRLPASLQNLQPFELDLIALAQGVSYKGEIEDRFKSLAEYLLAQVQPLLVIDHFYRVADRQSVLNGIMPYLKKLLFRNRLQVVCMSTVNGYTKDIERDKELMTFFEKITVEEPSAEEAVSILRSKVENYERFHHLPVEEDVPAEIVRLAKRYMSDRRLPSSAIDLLDRAMASVKISNEEVRMRGESATVQEILRKEAVRGVVSKITGIPMGDFQHGEREKLARGEDILHRRVVGQHHAVRSVLDAVYESRSGLNKKGQPIGSFFFLGPTGTGKTELAKALAGFLFDDESNMLRFDMSEYKEEHSVALLYGAPPGYVGYEEGGLLVNQIRRHPYSVVLFDEIEKAHRSVFDLFLQILDEGKLHDRLGRVGDFSNALIIFTSNLGSDYIFKSFGEGKVPTHDQLLEVMQGQFRPEFLARLTEIVPFSPITAEMSGRIFDIHIESLLKTLQEQNVKLDIDATARRYVMQTGFNAHYGARPILGIIRKEIRRPLSKLIISGDIISGDVVTMRYDEAQKQICWDIDTPNVPINQ